MRLRHLSLCGIGPFHHAHEVDFSSFEDSGLFLLEGPTGAGKSTLVDALTFALYGDVARQKDSDRARLRSSYCAPKDPSWVELVFEVPRGLYRVRRTPTFSKPGRKSQVNTTVLLERVAEVDGVLTQVEPLSRSIGEADSQIVDLIGLTKDQFLQTVILPQGKFSRFLTATSEEREGILRDIFDASIYLRLQEELRTRAAASVSAVEAARTEVSASLAAFRRIARLSQADPAGEAGAKGVDEGGNAVEALDLNLAGVEDILTACDPALVELEQRNTSARAHVATCEDTAAKAASALEKGRTLTTLQEEHAGLTARLEELKEAEAEVSELRVNLANSRRSRPALAPTRRHASARVAAEEAQEEAERTVRTLSELLSAPVVAQLTLPALPEWPSTPDSDGFLRPLQALTPVRNAALSAQERLAHLTELETTLDARRREETRLRIIIEELESERAGYSRTLREEPAKIAQVEAILEDRRRAAEPRASLGAQIEALEPRIAAATEADQWRTELKTLSEGIRRAAEDAVIARAAASKAHATWIAEVAVSLSTTLEEGEACPVCGSATHPTPAHTRIAPDASSSVKEPVVTRARLDELDAASTKADAVLAEARGAHSRAVERITALNDVARGDSTSLALAKSELEAQLAAAEEAAADVVAIEEALVQARAELECAREASRALGETLAAHRASLEALTTASAADEARLAKENAAGHDLAELATAVEELLSATAASEAALHTWEAARSRMEEARAARDEALATAGLPAGDAGVEALEAILMVETEENSAEARIASHDEALRATRARLAAEEIAQCTLAPAPDLGALSSAFEAARASLRSAEQDLLALDGRLEDARAARDEVETCANALVAARQAAGPVRRLAALATASTGENLFQTPLASWVLMSRFEEVLAAANPRLRAISEGRYELERSLDDGTRSRKSGLGLRIIDHDTEEVRPTKTLSGGETFYTSLALALGLADVVTAEAGGVELRTMFIDEGFGSLDSGKLDIVMGQLEALREQGRTVGIISHVEEMSRRIADQINVRWNPTRGSTLTVRA